MKKNWLQSGLPLMKATTNSLQNNTTKKESTFSVGSFFYLSITNTSHSNSALERPMGLLDKDSTVQVHSGSGLLGEHRHLDDSSNDWSSYQTESIR